MAVEVPLTTRGLCALVDDDDAPLILGMRWHGRPIITSRGVAGWYAKNVDGDTKRTRYMHRLILGLKSGDPYVDHINHDGLDNRRQNLRLATYSQNIANQEIGRAKARNALGYRGVLYDLRCKNFRARVKVNGRQIYTKAFDTAAEAARAWDELALRHYGEFASLNFPDLREAA